jgi:hypothetical protein
MTFDLRSLCVGNESFHAILMDPPWSCMTPHDLVCATCVVLALIASSCLTVANHIYADTLKTTIPGLSSIVASGFIFCWTEKEVLADVWLIVIALSHSHSHSHSDSDSDSDSLSLSLFVSDVVVHMFSLCQ